MQFLRAIGLMILATIRYRWILFLNRKTIKELKRLSKQDPKLLIRVRLSDENPRKIAWDMDYLD